MNRWRTYWIRWFGGWMIVSGMLASTLATSSEIDLAARLKQGGHVLMLRHAHALGFGDPPEFQLDDCATQRNLDASGRAQATAIGEWLHRQGGKPASIPASGAAVWKPRACSDSGQ